MNALLTTCTQRRSTLANNTVTRIMKQCICGAQHLSEYMSVSAFRSAPTRPHSNIGQRPSKVRFSPNRRGILPLKFPPSFQDKGQHKQGIYRGCTSPHGPHVSRLGDRRLIEPCFNRTFLTPTVARAPAHFRVSIIPAPFFPFRVHGSAKPTKIVSGPYTK